jgi:hypothetical protein
MRLISKAGGWLLDAEYAMLDTRFILDGFTKRQKFDFGSF